jgi:hypothetical protein
LQFTPSNATPKIAKEYVFANASKFAEKSLWVTMYIKNRAVLAYFKGNFASASPPYF